MFRVYSNVTDVVLVFLLLPLDILHTFSSVSVADFQQVHVSWVKPPKTKIVTNFVT